MTQSRSIRIAALSVIMVVVACGPASSRTVRDPHIGWAPSKLSAAGLTKLPRKGCQRQRNDRVTETQKRLDALPDPEATVKRIFSRDGLHVWGGIWSDFCDGGRLHIAVASGGSEAHVSRALSQARRYVKDAGLSRYVRFVAVRSTYFALTQKMQPFVRRYRRDFRSGVLSIGLKVSRNAVRIEVAPGLPSADRTALRKDALRSPVNVILQPVPVGDTGSEDY